MFERQSNESALRPATESDTDSALLLFNRLERETLFFPWLQRHDRLRVNRDNDACVQEVVNTRKIDVLIDVVAYTPVSRQKA